MRAATKALSFSRPAASFATARSCGSRKRGFAGREDSTVQLTSRSRHPLGRIAVSICTPSA
ncbi:Uncharacterised protein [Mycobacterium tuberculosis]|nr:Uncharacterised protein [Mycobacterium tuberculosis]